MTFLRNKIYISTESWSGLQFSAQISQFFRIRFHLISRSEEVKIWFSCCFQEFALHFNRAPAIWCSEVAQILETLPYQIFQLFWSKKSWALWILISWMTLPKTLSKIKYMSKSESGRLRACLIRSVYLIIVWLCFKYNPVFLLLKIILYVGESKFNHSGNRSYSKKIRVAERGRILESRHFCMCNLWWYAFLLPSNFKNLQAIFKSK